MSKTRFDYVKYDNDSVAMQAMIKKKVLDLEALLEGLGPKTRWHELFIDNLEYTYMCAGKYLRDLQLSRNPETELEP